MASEILQQIELDLRFRCTEERMMELPVMNKPKEWQDIRKSEGKMLSGRVSRIARW